MIRSITAKTTGGHRALMADRPAFTAADLGARLEGAGLPADTFVHRVVSETIIIMTKHSTLANTGTITVVVSSDKPAGRDA
jgi:hypothetical protein